MPSIPGQPGSTPTGSGQTTTPPGASSSNTQPTHSLKGWNAMTSALASDLPTALARAAKLRAAALRALH